MDLINISSLIIVSLLGVERLLDRLNCSSDKNFHLTCSKCLKFDIENQAVEEKIDERLDTLKNIIIEQRRNSEDSEIIRRSFEKARNPF